MNEYMTEVLNLWIQKQPLGHRSGLSLAQQLIVEECFKRGNSVNGCVTILLDG